MSGLAAAGKFILKWAIVGLAMACIVLLIRPDWLQKKGSRWRASGDAPMSYADAVARSSPAVVNIYTSRVLTEAVPSGRPAEPFGGQWPAYRPRIQSSLGSGVLVDAEGHVVTNNHVICNAQQRWLQLADGRSEAARVVGTDPETDIAVLKISLKQLPVMPLGRSDELRVGDVVLAIGNPYGLSQTVTQGIVSATGRGQLGLSTFENFIQTDAAINLGNSGGALINARGELVGINTAVLAQELGTEGIGFAIPVNLVRGVLEQIIRYGHVKRGWFGVDSQDLSSDEAAEMGLGGVAGIIVNTVTPGSPAERAGLLPGDVIVRLNGESRTAAEALNLVARTPPGSAIQLSIIRAGVAHDLTATLVERVVATDSSKNCGPGVRN